VKKFIFQTAKGFQFPLGVETSSVFAEDESHLLSGDTVGYVWGSRNERIEFPIRAHDRADSVSTVSFLNFRRPIWKNCIFGVTNFYCRMFSVVTSTETQLKQWLDEVKKIFLRFFRKIDRIKFRNSIVSEKFHQTILQVSKSRDYAPLHRQSSVLHLNIYSPTERSALPIPARKNFYPLKQAFARHLAE